MIVFPANWTQHFGEHLITAYPPQGGGRYRYHERLRPASDFTTVVERLLREDPAFRVTTIGEASKIVTEEGEYGAWVKIEGLRESSPAQRFIGVVFTEDFVAVLDTLVIISALFDEFARRSFEFLRSASFGLGPRRRLFLYSPPPDWQALPSGLVANFYPPDYPANRTNLIVLPATPTTQSIEEIIESRLASLSAGLQLEDCFREPFHSATRYSGVYLRVSGRPEGKNDLVYRDATIFVIDKYVYMMRLESMSLEGLLDMRELFRAVSASFRPLPQPHERSLGLAFAHAPTTAVDAWAE